MAQTFGSAREMFEAARAAAREAERIARDLRDLDEDEPSGGGGFEGRVHGTPDPDRIGRRVASSLDRRAMLEARQAEDYRLIDAACAVLYGPDNRGGLYALVGWPADAIYHHYLGLRTWEETAELVIYSKRYVQEQVAWAFDMADANGDMWTRLGIGMAQA